MLTNDDIAMLKASAQAAIDNPMRPFTVAPELILQLTEELRASRITTLRWVSKYVNEMLDNVLDNADLHDAAQRYEAVRKLDPGQFAELYQRKLRGESFDALVDEMGAK